MVLCCGNKQNFTSILTATKDSANSMSKLKVISNNNVARCNVHLLSFCIIKIKILQNFAINIFSSVAISE